MRETLDRLNTGSRSGSFARGYRENTPIDAEIDNQEPSHRALGAAENVSNRCAAVREDGGEGNFQEWSDRCIH